MRLALTRHVRVCVCVCAHACANECSHVGECVRMSVWRREEASTSGTGPGVRSEAGCSQAGHGSARPRGVALRTRRPCRSDRWERGHLEGSGSRALSCLQWQV